MAKRATSKFVVKTWEEKPYEQTENGGKLTRASVTQSYQGDIEGEGRVEFVMAYPDEKTATFVGMQHVVGRLDGRSGSFVLQCTGTHEGSAAKCTWFVVPGSGTGELRGLRGEGGYVAKHEDYPNVPVTLDFYFE